MQHSSHIHFVPRDSIPMRDRDGDSTTVDETSQASSSDDDDNDSGVAKVQSVVYVTASATFSGPTAGFVTIQPTTAVASTKAVSSSPTAKSQGSSASAKSAVSSGTTAAASTASVASTAAATSASTVVPVALSQTASSTGGPSSTAEPKHDSGMSGGAKGGIAFAVILLVALAAGAAFYFYRKKKAQREADGSMQRLEEEKSAMRRNGTLTPAIATAFKSNDDNAPSPAPRVSLRPTSHFSPYGGAADPEKAAPTPISKTAIKPTANAQNDPSNPFGNHAQTLESRPREVARPGSYELQGSPVPLNPLASNPSDSALPASAAAAGGAAAGALAGAAAASSGSTNTAAAPASTVHRVQLDFVPTMDDELELKAGMLIRMLHEYDDGWALCTSMDRTQQGVAPRTCFSKLPLKPRPTGPSAPAPLNTATRNVTDPGARGPPSASSMVPAPLSQASGQSSPARARSNSTGTNASSPTRLGSVPASPALTTVPARKPVPGQAI